MQEPAGPSAKNLKDAIEAITKAKNLTLRTEDDDVDARELLKSLSSIKSRLERERTKQKKPHLDAGRSVDESFKPTKDSLEKAMAQVKAAMQARLAAVRAAQMQAEKQRQQQAQEAVQMRKAAGAEGVSADDPALDFNFNLDQIDDDDSYNEPEYVVRRSTDLEVYDESRIPREFLVPDKAKIKQALTDGTLVPGCRLVHSDKIVAR